MDEDEFEYDATAENLNWADLLWCAVTPALYFSRGLVVAFENLRGGLGVMSYRIDERKKVRREMAADIEAITRNEW